MEEADEIITGEDELIAEDDNGDYDPEESVTIGDLFSPDTGDFFKQFEYWGRKKDAERITYETGRSGYRKEYIEYDLYGMRWGKNSTKTGENRKFKLYVTLR